MRKPSAVSLVVSLVLVALPLGCGGGTEDPSVAGADSGSHGTIGLSVLTLTNPFFKIIADTMRDEAAAAGYELLVVSGENDPATQQNQVRDFIVRKVAAIVLTPCDSEAIGQAVRAANEAGIPVFTADIACTAAGVEVVSHVATDNYLGGRLAAQAVAQALGDRGKVAIVDHPTVESAMLRRQGFEDELRESGSQIEVVGTWAGMGARDESFKVSQEILQAHPDLDGFFCVNDPSALGTRAAVEIAQKTDRIRIVGFDGQLEGKKAIRDGRIFADPVQFPDQIGRQTVQTILRYFEGEEVEREILIPPRLYFQSDAAGDPALEE